MRSPQGKSVASAGKSERLPGVIRAGSNEVPWTGELQSPARSPSLRVAETACAKRTSTCILLPQEEIAAFAAENPSAARGETSRACVKSDGQRFGRGRSAHATEETDC